MALNASKNTELTKMRNSSENTERRPETETLSSIIYKISLYTVQVAIYSTNLK